MFRICFQKLKQKQKVHFSYKMIFFIVITVPYNMLHIFYEYNFE